MGRIFVVVLIAIIAIPLACCADTAADTGTEKTVTANLPAMNLESALKLITGGADVTLSIAPEAAKLSTTPITLSDVKLGQAITAVCRSAGAGVAARGRTFTVTATPPATDPPASPPSTLPARLSLGITKAEVQQIKGKPEHAVVNTASGEETWYYSDQRLIFRTSRLAEIKSNSLTSVNLGVQTGNHYIPATTSARSTTHRSTSQRPKSAYSSVNRKTTRRHTGGYSYVRGHYTKKGTYVRPYYRRK